MGGLCSKPDKSGAKDKKQGLARGKNELRCIEPGREAYKECVKLLEAIA